MAGGSVGSGVGLGLGVEEGVTLEIGVVRTLGAGDAVALGPVVGVLRGVTEGTGVCDGPSTTCVADGESGLAVAGAGLAGPGVQPVRLWLRSRPSRSRKGLRRRTGTFAFQDRIKEVAKDLVS